MPRATILVVRLFIALTPPPVVVEELRTATEALRADRSGMRWTGPEQWHLTLAFLGQVDDRARDELTERLARVAARHPPLALSLGGGGRFGDRVLWTRVLGETDGLRRLAASVQAAARRARLPVDERPYRPHLTLARRTGVHADLRPAVTELAGFAGRPWTAEELHLVRSHLGAGPGGTARHEPIDSWQLGRREP
ncbi:RNA 2',3'-cyclic phosphodiesterase [Pseudonocardia sp. H11422]|uniref:RNA 2',3'-cyclic phosphodiesterase n=1 Tax=Pseudonocardia sp. H11422 TaxID=2835866 RepID=UPI001BDBD7A9|nr:RNA 2',3'-cyclic phosphodiesterase [Pseudonocardia sp. H11422]